MQVGRTRTSLKVEVRAVREQGQSSDDRKRQIRQERQQIDGLGAREDADPQPVIEMMSAVGHVQRSSQARAPAVYTDRQTDTHTLIAILCTPTYTCTGRLHRKTDRHADSNTLHPYIHVHQPSTPTDRQTLIFDMVVYLNLPSVL